MNGMNQLWARLTAALHHAAACTSMAWRVLVRDDDPRAHLARRILGETDADSNLIQYAARELAALLTPDGVEKADSMNRMMARDVLDLVRVMASQGHSGSSAPYALALFGKVADWLPLSPLTGDVKEWGPSYSNGKSKGTRTRQNLRCSRVFCEVDEATGKLVHAYDTEAVVFEYPDGGRFLSNSSHQPVTFPYTPRTVTVCVGRDDLDEVRAALARSAWTGVAHKPFDGRVTTVYPERDAELPAERQGLFRKYDVRRVDGEDGPGGRHHGCELFVLDLSHDRHAVPAIQAYANACRETHPQLARDLDRRHGRLVDLSELIAETALTSSLPVRLEVGKGCLFVVFDAVGKRKRAARLCLDVVAENQAPWMKGAMRAALAEYRARLGEPDELGKPDEAVQQ
jgi:hypothetical protein